MTSSLPNMPKLSAAFDLVSPRVRAQKLAAAGLISEKAAVNVHWKDEISALVTDEMLVAASVTIEDVREAIIHYTATVPTITREKIGKLAWETMSARRDRSGYLVRADGYQKGPAGDRG